jgi:pilus assembly protein CpaB
MRLDRRFAIVVALSLVWALVVSAVFYRLARGPDTGAAYSRNHKPLVVAARPLPLGDTVSRESVHMRSVPEDLFPRGGFSRVEDVLDRPVISPILPDEPIVDSRLASRGAGPGLGPMIPTGMRAISVRVNDVVGVAGFILPGMHVDVLSTGRALGHDEIVTRTVLENITVLSVGQTVQVDARSQAINAAVVTLLVNPEEAEALTLANNEGRIQLVLRNSTDQKPLKPRGRELHELFAAVGGKEDIDRSLTVAAPTKTQAPTRAASVSERRAAPALPPPLRPVADEIVMIRGSKKTLEPIAAGRTNQ